ncbi:MAG: hypothetical protein LBS57_03920, partial [Treponema sp.]|nr:hypothetical protein [Treponema sp.]
MRQNGSFGIALVLAALFMVGCDLLNNKPEIDAEKTIDEKAACANAPYVPIKIEEGGLGSAGPRGALDTAVKAGYSLFVNYIPKTEYPFQGWQAKPEESHELPGYWEPGMDDNELAPEKVKFVPRNEE